MKITDYKGAEALDLLADVLEPVATILADAELSNLWKSGQQLMLVKTVLKKYPSEIVEVLARIDGVPVEEYNGNLITMTASLLQMLNDDALKPFFPSQELTKTSSISATANTKARKK